MLPDDYKKHQAKESQELKDEICERIANGETLRAICREDGKPSFVSVYNWLNADDDFALRFARAREIGHDVISEDCLAIADESGADAVVDEKTGGLKVDGEVIQRAKLRIETRLKLLAKWNPKKWGEKLDLTHAGAIKSERELTEADRALIDLAIDHKINGGKDGKVIS